MDRSIGGPRTRSVVGVRVPGVSVFGLPNLNYEFIVLGVKREITVDWEIHFTQLPETLLRILTEF